MKLELWWYHTAAGQKSGKLRVTRESGDPKFYGVKDAAGESRFLYYLKGFLEKEFGWSLIKKRMWRDGHLVNEVQQYLRTPDSKVMLWNDHWAVAGLEQDWNRGEAVLSVWKQIERKQENV